MAAFSDKEKLKRLELSNERFSLDTTGKEIVVILLSGTIDVEGNTLSRDDVFSSNAQGFYVANCGICKIESTKFAELCVIESFSEKKVHLSTLKKKNMIFKKAGKGNFERTVVTLLDAGSGLQNLIVGETFKSKGNWSSWPPHKHDTKIVNEESSQKEIYLYKFKEPAGFGIQLLYDDFIENSEAHVVRNNQQIKIEKGYHPVVASPDSEMYYLWALFGDNNFFKVRYENAELR